MIFLFLAGILKLETHKGQEVIKFSIPKLAASSILISESFSPSRGKTAFKAISPPQHLAFSLFFGISTSLVDVPVLKIDEPMAEKAVQMGDTIGVLATARTTLTNSSELVKSKAELKGRSVKIKSLLCQEAFQALLRGDREKHDHLAKEAALKLAKNTDVVVLAQASLSHLVSKIQKETKTPILTSPGLAIAAIRRILGID